MDFLDPRKKKHRTIRLLIGYVLMAIAIGLGTIILVYGAYGYGIDTKTGQITENGLLFVDSRPGGANISLNGKDQNKTTSARMVLSAGEYDLLITKAGYRPWQRSFSLEEHNIARYVYPFLFPENLKPVALKNYSAQPLLTTISPDRRFLMVQNPAVVQNLSFDMYDTGDIKQGPRVVNFPAKLLTKFNNASSRVTEVEWSTDNAHLLVRHAYTGGSEFIILNRSNPTDSINVNKQLGINPSEVFLRDKRINELYIYDDVTKTLRRGNVNQKSLGSILIKDVLAYKVYGRDLITYITPKNAKPGEMAVRIWDDGKDYPLNSVKAGSKYQLDIAQFQGHWYYVASSDTENLSSIYKDPLDSVKDARVKAARPMIAFDLLGVSKVSFSANTRFVLLQAGQKFGIYDFEVKKQYQYDLTLPIVEPLAWMDGHRLIGSSNGSAFVMDYDSVNQQTLAPTTLSRGGLFSRNYEQFYCLTPAVGSAEVTLTRFDMRAGEDLPQELR